jgi:hypothetical protein
VNFGLDAFSHATHALRRELIYPERGTSDSLIRATFRSNDVHYLEE